MSNRLLGPNNVLGTSQKVVNYILFYLIIFCIFVKHTTENMLQE